MKVLFFSPHSIPWKHAFPEAIVADSLHNAGCEISYFTCGGALGDYCIPKISKITSDVRNRKLKKACKAICSECQSVDKYIRKTFNLGGATIQSALSQDCKDEVDRIISNLDIRDAFQLKYRGISIGKIAFYQIILRHKLIKLVVSPDLKDRYLSELRDTYYSAYALKNIIESKKIDAIVLYNSMYSVNKIVAEVARYHGIDTYSIHAGSNLSERLQSLIISKDDAYSFYSNLIQNWPKFSGCNHSPSEYRKVTEHFKELLNAKSIFTYSTKKSLVTKSIREFFTIPDRSKILVATMASYDEEVAAEFIGAKKIFDDEIFDTQIDWIKALINYAEKKQDIFLIIRPHPREFTNKREKTTSEHARQILELAASKLPPNVSFNLPEDGISIYDFIGEADVFLNSWSNVGKEIAIFGVPVVIYSKNNLYYHPDLNYIGSNKIDYFKKIEEAIANGWSFDYVMKVFKWYVYEQQTALISLHSVCNLKEANCKSLITVAFEKFLKILDPRLLYFFNVRFFRKNYFDGSVIRELIESRRNTLLDFSKATDNQKEYNEIHSLRIEFLNILKMMYPKKTILQKSRIYNNFISSFTVN
ncbi:hypothetical protein NHB34_01745 [Polynucleobacter sp. MWH-UH19D]|uniref:hypothetical protein n=1 Tax=Polynucleobacter sp. MWH-UH19D TaxID=1855610 RepID=UPI003364B42F